MPIVLVELPAADAADVNAPALIAACSSGLRRGSCAVEEVPGGERATAVAIVAWLDAEHLRARIDVGRRAEQRGGWQVRELTFHEQDALAERWRSVGLAIAGVVGEATLLEPAKPAPEKMAPSKTVAVRPPVSWPAFRLALGPVVESGLSAEKPSLGPWLDLGWRWSPKLPLELTVTAANAWSLRETSRLATRFTTLGVGPSGTLAAGQGVLLRASLCFALEAVDASITDVATGAHSSGARWLLGGLTRVEVVWPWSSSGAGVLGFEIVRLSGATALRVHDETAAVSPAWHGGVQAGLEWKF